MPSNNKAHNALVKEVLQVFNAHHAFAFQTNVINLTLLGGSKRYHIKQGVVGMADILGLVPVSHLSTWDKFLAVWVECKTGSGKQTEFQKSFQYDVENRFHRYILCRDTRELEKELWG